MCALFLLNNLTSFINADRPLCLPLQCPQPSALQIEQTPKPKKMLPASQLQFGHSFTDHMLLIPWSHSTGWGAPTIKPYGPLNLDPSSTVLHYACTLFEGMKAYRDAETGRVSLFRPDKNMARMNSSAARLAFPVGFHPPLPINPSILKTRADLSLTTAALPAHRLSLARTSPNVSKS